MLEMNEYVPLPSAAIQTQRRPKRRKLSNSEIFEVIEFEVLYSSYFGKKARQFRPTIYCQNSNSQILPLTPESIP